MLPSLSVKVLLVRVAGFMATLKVAVTFASARTLVAPAVGEVARTEGAGLSSNIGSTQ